MKKIVLVLALAAAGCGDTPRIAWDVQGMPLGTFAAVEEGTGRTYELRAACTAALEPDTWTCSAAVTPGLRGKLIRIRRTVNVGQSSISPTPIRVP